MQMLFEILLLSSHCQQKETTAAMLQEHSSTAHAVLRHQHHPEPTYLKAAGDHLARCIKEEVAVCIFQLAARKRVELLLLLLLLHRSCWRHVGSCWPWMRFVVDARINLMEPSTL